MLATNFLKLISANLLIILLGSISTPVIASNIGLNKYFLFCVLTTLSAIMTVFDSGVPAAPL